VIASVERPAGRGPRDQSADVCSAACSVNFSLAIGLTPTPRVLWLGVEVISSLLITSSATCWAHGLVGSKSCELGAPLGHAIRGRERSELLAIGTKP